MSKKKTIIRFQCTRCGKCCREHRGPMLGQLHGLMLMPNEVQLFPSELIKPMFRYHPNTDPSIAGMVWMYQLDSDGCPHYDEERRICEIYEKRPILCRAYPFEWRGNSVMCHEACSEIERLNKLKVTLSVPRKEVEAAVSIQEYQHEFMRREINVERYDLKTQSWRGVLEGLNSGQWKWLKESAQR